MLQICLLRVVETGGVLSGLFFVVSFCWGCCFGLRLTRVCWVFLVVFCGCVLAFLVYKDLLGKKILVIRL